MTRPETTEPTDDDLYVGTITAVIRVRGYQPGIDEIADGLRSHLADYVERPDIRHIRVSTRPTHTWRTTAAIVAVVAGLILGVTLTPTGIVAGTRGYLATSITIAGTGLVLLVSSTLAAVRWLRRETRREQADVLR